MLHQHVLVMAAYGTGGLKRWLQDNVVTLVILALGVVVLWSAKGGNISKGITIVGGVVVGLMVLALASGSNATDLGNFLVGLFKS